MARKLEMDSKHFLVVLGLLAVACLIVAVEAAEDKADLKQAEQNSTTTKIDKQFLAKKKQVKTRVTRDVATAAAGSLTSTGSGKLPASLLQVSSLLSSRKSQLDDLMTAAHEKKYMLVKKKPKHKKIKMEVFKPKMKYKKIKMKIPVKKMKKKKVKGYLVKKEHHHHEGH